MAFSTATKIPDDTPSPNGQRFSLSPETELRIEFPSIRAQLLCWCLVPGKFLGRNWQHHGSIGSVELILPFLPGTDARLILTMKDPISTLSTQAMRLMPT